VTEVPLLYNLFPRLVGPTTRWAEHARRAAEMGFNWLYLNPWHYPGFSGSLYAPKEFRRLNPLFVPPGADERDLDLLSDALGEIAGAGLRPMMDLVINHTAKDALLTQEHPEWYLRDEKGELVSPFVREAHDPTQITVWGDLAEIDYQGRGHREALRRYWADLVRDSLELGFRGFRCDAAYKVPAEVWHFLIEEARAVDPEVRFFAETLGAPVEKVLSLREAGFDYFFNSSKWWDFDETWALDQHEAFGRIAPSIAFPETHDTTRLAADSGGDEAVQRQRYAFAAAFSAGVMMPIGYEFGFRKQVNVVHTMPGDWERHAFDLRGFVAGVNRRKQAHAVLQGEGRLRAPLGLDGEVLVLQRDVEGAGAAPAYILVNKRADGDARLPLGAMVGQDAASRYRLHRVCRDGAPEQGEPVPAQVDLASAEVVYVLPA
jgi:starch synthase (maltosyl-transferring)